MEPFMTAQQVAESSGGKVREADPRIPVLLAAATAAVRRYCGWHVAPVVTETQVLDGHGSCTMQLRSTHVRTVTGLWIAGAAITEADYGWSQAGMVELYSGQRFPDRFRAVKVLLEHGYEFAEVPDVTGLILRKTLGALASPLGATREQAGELAVSWGRTGLPMTVDDLTILAPLRLQNWP